MAADFDLQGVIKLRDETKAGAESATDNVNKFKESTEEAGKKTKGFGTSLTELKSGLDLLAGGLRTVAEVGKQAFEFAEQGAVVNQTAESFGRLGANLDAMRAATNGTVDDMTLMSSTLTLTAGASDTLQQALLQAAPDLLEIAKASNKLNPTLGDTAFLYQSLATGIKRSSPLILDNLGLTISVADANEKFAQKAGKAADALTKEEQQLALLQEALASGNRLLEQAGGSTESLTDGYARLTTATTNLNNELARAASKSGGFFDNLGKGVDGLAKWQKALNFARDNGLSPLGAQIEVVRDVLGASNTVFDQARAGTLGLAEEHARTWETLSQSAKAFEMYNQAQLQVADTTDYAAGAVQRMRNDTISSLDSWALYSQAMAQGEASMAAAATRAYELAAAEQAASDAAAIAQQSFLDGAAALGEYSTAQVAAAQLDALKAAVDAGKMSQEQYTTAQQNVLTTFGLLTPAEIAAQAQLDALTQSLLAGEITAQEYAAGSLATKAALDTVTTAETEAAAQAQELADKSVSATQREAELAAALEAAQAKLFGTSGAMGALSSSTATASGEVETLKQRIAALQDKVVTVTYRTIGQQEGNKTNADMNAAVEESRRNAGFARGGTIPINGPVLVGENGPELLMGARGARVIDNSRTQQIVNNFGGITVNSPVAAERLVQESRRARMMNVQI